MRPLNVGDRVKVKIPRIVVRVGYPKAVSDYLPEAVKAFGAQLRGAMHAKEAETVLRAIAYGLARKDGFGGRGRTLHFEEKEELLGREFTISHTRVVRTGVYFPPQYSTYSYHEAPGWGPGGLRESRAYRLVSGLGFNTLHWSSSRWDSLEFVSTDVELLEKGMK